MALLKRTGASLARLLGHVFETRTRLVTVFPFTLIVGIQRLYLSATAFAHGDSSSCQRVASAIVAAIALYLFVTDFVYISLVCALTSAGDLHLRWLPRTRSRLKTSPIAALSVNCILTAFYLACSYALRVFLNHVPQHSLIHAPAELAFFTVMTTSSEIVIVVGVLLAGVWWTPSALDKRQSKPETDETPLFVCLGIYAATSAAVNVLLYRIDLHWMTAALTVWLMSCAVFFLGLVPRSVTVLDRPFTPKLQLFAVACLVVVSSLLFAPRYEPYRPCFPEYAIEVESTRLVLNFLIVLGFWIARLPALFRKARTKPSE